MFGVFGGSKHRKFEGLKIVGVSLGVSGVNTGLVGLMCVLFLRWLPKKTTVKQHGS